MKIVDTYEYVSVLKDVVDSGMGASLVVAGNSMSPFLVDGRDSIYFERPSRPLRKGDMVFYQRESGQFVMHRIYDIRKEGLYIVGDAQVVVEGPVLPCRVFAVVTKVCRKGKWIGPNDFWWQFFARVWIRLIPFRKGLEKAYRLVRHV